METTNPLFDEMEAKLKDPKCITITAEKPSPMEILEDVMIKLHGKFDQALHGNDFPTIIKYSEAMTAVAKAITDMQSGHAATAMMERTISELRSMLEA